LTDVPGTRPYSNIVFDNEYLFVLLEDVVNELPGIALPGYVWAIVGIGVVGLPAATLLALARGARAVGTGTRTAAVLVAVGGLVWTGWIGGSVALAAAGVYRGDATAPNPWTAVTLLAVLSALLLATRTPVLRRILADTGTPARLAAAQTFRVVGGVFLVVAALGHLPAVFAVPAGIGDVAVGVAAPFVAWRLSHGQSGRQHPRREAVWFNVLGIVDLIVAVGIGFLAAPGPANLLAVTPSTAALTMLPLVLIPTGAVPLAVALHVVSLRRLRATATASIRPAVPVAG
jgi:hypothetical protein